MAHTFVIEDDFHAETIATFGSLEAARLELTRLSRLPWDQEPNVAPCQSWRTCRRSYALIEYEAAAEPWKEVRRHPAFMISADGIEWDTPNSSDVA